MTPVAAQLVPQAVEKLPLFHWHPGWRLLCVGDRDGARFDGAADAAAGRSFQRPLDAAVLAEARARSGCEGFAAVWSAGLCRPIELRLLAEQDAPLVLVTSGHGDAALLANLLPRCDAVLLLVGSGGPLDHAICTGARHVEVVLGLDGVCTPPTLPWGHIAAVHLQPLRAALAVGSTLEAWEDAARAALPQHLPIYDSRCRHSLCACGETLIWRSGGRSRLDALDPVARRCAVCGAPSAVVT